MGLFDKIKKVIDDSGVIDAAKGKASDLIKEDNKAATVNKPECEHGKCYVYNGSLCCNCSDNVICDKKNQYSAENRLDPKLVDFYKEYHVYETLKNKHNLDVSEQSKKRKSGLNATSLYIKAYQPKLSFLSDIIFDYYINGSWNHFDNDATRFVKRMQFVELPDDYYDKIKYIWDSFRNNKLDISLDWVYNSSLYSRSFDEFKYATNVLNMSKNEAFLSSHLKDISVVNIDEFFDENGNIKESGIDGREGDTIYNVFERWSENNTI